MHTAPHYIAALQCTALTLYLQCHVFLQFHSCKHQFKLARLQSTLSDNGVLDLRHIPVRAHVYHVVLSTRLLHTNLEHKYSRHFSKFHFQLVMTGIFLEKGGTKIV